jgi:hypothetical protein
VADDGNIVDEAIDEVESDAESDGGLFDDDDSEDEDGDLEVENEDEDEAPFSLSPDQLRALTWTVHDAAESRGLHIDAPTDYYDEEPRPTRAAEAFADSPLGLFFFFLPKLLWKRIAEESNAFRASLVDKMAIERQQKQQRRQAQDPNVQVQSLQDIKDIILKWKPITPHEVVHFVALLIARALSPQRGTIKNHWTTTEVGAVPRGTFGRFMARQRFLDIARFLHFASNSNVPRHDRAWKVRPLLQVVEKTFRRGFRLGSRVSFDEGMVGSRHRMNPMRVYMKDKPVKWGSKFYMTCCADTAYCVR